MTTRAPSLAFALFFVAVAGANLNAQAAAPSASQLSIRAMGRTQSAEFRDSVLPFLRSPTVALREEAANALAQMNAAVDFESFLKTEQVGSVRGALFESLGRSKSPITNAEQLLAVGLSDTDAAARLGAARGLEALVRQKGRGARVAVSTTSSMHAAFLVNTTQPIRELLLLTMNAAADADSGTFKLALRDTSTLVRRLAVIGSKQWVDDKSPLVRYEALRAARNCERALQLSNDASEMVQLAAIDMLGDRKCDATPLNAFVRTGKNWRVRAHALVALAKTLPDSARSILPAFVTDPLWHTRVYAATAARVLADSATLGKLAHDAQPNVATEAITTPTDAIFNLNGSHAGLLFTAASRLKGTPELAEAMPKIVSALQRLGKERRASSTDARSALLERVGEVGGANDANGLQDAVRDLDPTIVRRASELERTIRTRTGQPSRLINNEFPLSKRIPAPSAATVASLRGATAQISMKGLGVITLELFTDDAPSTVSTFAALADSGKYNGLTFHRIVPNFVIQGGSPGADEYDGLTTQFMRDEVGRTSHSRGTLGISTRGYDTGDGQIFINLVDNFRLDHAYTVFARVTSGMDIVDKIQEGDVMESVKIIRKK